MGSYPPQRPHAPSTIALPHVCQYRNVEIHGCCHVTSREKSCLFSILIYAETVTVQIFVRGIIWVSRSADYGEVGTVVYFSGWGLRVGVGVWLVCYMVPVPSQKCA